MAKLKFLRWFTWLVPLLLWVAFLRSVGVPIRDSVLYIGYFAFYVLAPGIVYLTLIRRDVGSRLALLAYGAVLGLCAECVLYLLFLVSGAQDHFSWSILLPALLAAANWNRLRRPLLMRLRTPLENSAALAITLLVFASLFIGTLAVFTFPTDRHHVVQGAIATSTTMGWPLSLLTIADTRIGYHWLAHLDIAATHIVTDIPIMVLASRIAPAMHFGVLIVMIFAFSKRHFRDRGFIATAVVIQVLWVAGHGSTLATKVLGGAVPTAMSLVISSVFGFSVFFLLTDTILAFGRRRDLDLALIGTLVVLGLAAAGVRSALSPILLCALAFLIVARRLAGRSWSGRYAIALGCILSTFGAGLILFYRVQEDIAATGFLEVTWHPIEFFLENQETFIVTKYLAALGVPASLAALAAFGVIVVFHAGFLTPGLFYRLRGMARSASDLELWLLGVTIAGIAAAFLTEAGGGSQFTFLHYAHFSMALLGALGLRRLLSRARRGGPRATAWLVLVGLSGAWLLAHLAEQGFESLRYREQVERRAAYPDMWTRPRPTNALAWLRQNRSDNAVLVIVEEWLYQNAIVRPLIIDSGGVQILLSEGWILSSTIDTRPNLKVRYEAVTRLIESAGGRRLATEQLSAIAASLEPAQQLYVLAPNAATPDRPDRVFVLTTDSDLTLYRFESRG